MRGILLLALTNVGSKAHLGGGSGGGRILRHGRCRSLARWRCEAVVLGRHRATVDRYDRGAVAGPECQLAPTGKRRCRHHPKSIEAAHGKHRRRQLRTTAAANMATSAPTPGSSKANAQIDLGLVARVAAAHTAIFGQKPCVALQPSRKTWKYMAGCWAWAEGMSGVRTLGFVGQVSCAPNTHTIILVRKHAAPDGARRRRPTGQGTHAKSISLILGARILRWPVRDAGACEGGGLNMQRLRCPVQPLYARDSSSP